MIAKQFGVSPMTVQNVAGARVQTHKGVGA
jgi:hypothetical protein